MSSPSTAAAAAAETAEAYGSMEEGEESVGGLGIGGPGLGGSIGSGCGSRRTCTACRSAKARGTGGVFVCVDGLRGDICLISTSYMCTLIREPQLTPNSIKTVAVRPQVANVWAVSSGVPSNPHLKSTCPNDIPKPQKLTTTPHNKTTPTKTTDASASASPASSRCGSRAGPPPRSGSITCSSRRKPPWRPRPPPGSGLGER